MYHVHLFPFFLRDKELFVHLKVQKTERPWDLPGGPVLENLPFSVGNGFILIQSRIPHPTQLLSMYSAMRIKTAKNKQTKNPLKEQQKWTKIFFN